MTLSLTRRAVLAQATAAAAVLAMATPTYAVTTSQAQGMVDLLVRDVNAVIASGKSENAMLRDFEVIFDRYANVPYIAAYALGNERRRFTSAQMDQWIGVFRAYISRKYGRRFREFIGGQIVVVESRSVPNGVEVETTAILQGQAPFQVDFLVADFSGRPLFVNLIIEGINMLLSERTEILAMLDQRGGDIDRLIADLPQL